MNVCMHIYILPVFVTYTFSYIATYSESGLKLIFISVPIFHVKIVWIIVQVCELGALLVQKPTKRNERQQFLAMSDAYLSLSQDELDTNKCTSAERLRLPALLSSLLTKCTLKPLFPMAHSVTIGRHSGMQGSALGIASLLPFLVGIMVHYGVL